MHDKETIRDLLIKYFNGSVSVIQKSGLMIGSMNPQEMRNCFILVWKNGKDKTYNT